MESVEGTNASCLQSFVTRISIRVQKINLKTVYAGFLEAEMSSRYKSRSAAKNFICFQKTQPST